MQIGGRLRLIFQHAINTKPNLQLSRVRLDVYITCTHPNSINDHLVNGVYDCWVLTQVFFVNSEVINRFAFKRGSCADRSLNTRTEKALRSTSVETNYCFINICFIGKNGDNSAAGDELEFVYEHNIQDICQRNGEFITC